MGGNSLHVKSREVLELHPVFELHSNQISVGLFGGGRPRSAEE
jgi:hypothetical protein